MKRNKITKAFSSSTYTEWKKEAEALLKGAPFEKKMLTNTVEGITLQPIYNREDVKQTPCLPGQGNYIRGTSEGGYKDKPWSISQCLYASTPEEFNKKISDALKRGQTGVDIVLDCKTSSGRDADDKECECKAGKGGLSISLASDWGIALAGVEADCIELNIFGGVSLPFVAAMLYSATEGKDLKGGIFYDPISILARRGKLSCGLECAYDRMFALADYNSKKMKSFGAIGIDTLSYTSAGASCVEELGVALSTATAYIKEMLTRGMKINDIAKLIRFRFSLGSNFFMEIAKIRAARAMWSKIIQEFGGNAEARKMRIHARTAVFNKTTFDPYVNMLRTTTEAFSGVIGGVDSMCVAPFDEVVRKPDEFSMRTARNQQIVLQEECNLCDVVDPAGGSYYIEVLTDEVAKKSWEIFTKIESEGGIISALKSGMVQNMIAATAGARKKAYDTRRSVVVGTNSYANMSEKGLEKDCCQSDIVAKERSAAVKSGRRKRKVSFSGKKGANVMKAAIKFASKGASVGVMNKGFCECGDSCCEVQKLDIHRGVEHFEVLRSASDRYKAKNGHGPKLFLATMGPLVQHKARADFIRGFFEVGGFEVIYPNGFDDAESVGEAFKNSGAKYVVICSTDDTYPILVPSVTKSLKGKVKDSVVLLAGIPAQDQEQSYKEAGLDGSVNIRSNNYETLKAYLIQLGVLQ